MNHLTTSIVQSSVPGVTTPTCLDDGLNPASVSYSQCNVLTGHHCVLEIIWSETSWYLSYHVISKNMEVLNFFLCVYYIINFLRHIVRYTDTSLDDIYCSKFSTRCNNPHVLGWRPQPCVSSLQLDVGCPVVIAVPPWKLLLHRIDFLWDSSYLCTTLEHIWDMLGSSIQTREPPVQNFCQLEAALHREWQQLSQQV
jgi:hypothetical protein